jgi:hypothetical protein
MVARQTESPAEVPFQQAGCLLTVTGVSKLLTVVALADSVFHIG